MSQGLVTFYHDDFRQACHYRNLLFGIISNQTMIALNYALVRHLAVAL
jgi:hypothetical protein